MTQNSAQAWSTENAMAQKRHKNKNESRRKSHP